ncbi:unnamed protein product [Anisakis simplex]|uniref:Protein-lysine methyltransferase (inferred by orthology to a C. elegans protein) n=1 Tax=Anisakis simplex TaxID=6269 RepID=A0A0M3J904_ANISI|nr:unnamed protein product [Anisakis simplex]
MLCDEDEQYFVREVELDDKELRIYQEVNSDVGGVVWDSSIVACYYFLKNRHYWKNKKVLELGSGTGICSIVLAMFGAQVNATDLYERLPLIQLNVSKNEQFLKATTGCVSVEAFDWNEPPPPTNHYDVVLLVDAIYYLKGTNSVLNPICCLIKIYHDIKLLRKESMRQFVVPNKGPKPSNCC